MQNVLRGVGVNPLIGGEGGGHLGDLSKFAKTLGISQEHVDTQSSTCECMAMCMWIHDHVHFFHCQEDVAWVMCT
jgi:hypothetical protein